MPFHVRLTHSLDFIYIKHTMNTEYKIGIIGATGYTGVELLRLLANHPQAKVTCVTSRQEAGKPVAELFPSLRGVYDLVFSAPDDAPLDECDVVFFATPNGVAMNDAPALLAKGIKVIDLSADYRLQDIPTWEKWYGLKHSSPEWVKKAVYGLSELNHEAISQAQLIANPGCYPTAVSLGLLPLLQTSAIDLAQPLIADCKSGVSGSGRKAAIGSLLCEAGDNFKAYAVGGHRHLPEIKQTIANITYQQANLVFVPHLTPLIRGMHATLYVTLHNPDLDVQALYEQHYANQAFVDVLPSGNCPETRSVRGANLCRISIQKAPESNTYIILSVIDNLMKGAAGQAVQNMNLMLGLAPKTGLQIMPLLP